MRLINIGVFTLVLILAVAAYLKGANRHILGITEGMKTLASIIATTAFYTCFFCLLTGKFRHLASSPDGRR